MPMEIAVATAPGSISMTSGGALIGEVHLVSSGRAFPDERWSDFVVPVLTWWLQELDGLVSGRKDQAVLLFMDGPFEIHVKPVANRYHASFVHAGRIEFVDADVDPSDVLQQVLVAARAVGAEASRGGFRSADLDEMQRVARLLRTPAG